MEKQKESIKELRKKLQDKGNGKFYSGWTEIIPRTFSIYLTKEFVIIGDGIITPFLAFSLAKKHGIKTVYYCIYLDYELISQSIIQPIGKLFESYNISNADLVISINERLRDYIISMGV